MKLSRRALSLAVGAVVLGLAGQYWHQQHEQPAYLPGDTAEFVGLFAPPPAADSPQTRRELDELLEIQRLRTAEQSAAARDDSSTDVARFTGALGLKPGTDVQLPALRRFTQRVEDSIRPYVRDAKRHFDRARPYAIEPRIQPCLANTPRDASYPSGHATYAFVMASVLADVAPTRRTQLIARGEEFAHQRMVCGVHFASDIEAGRVGARWLLSQLRASPQYRADVVAATTELREVRTE